MSWYAGGHRHSVTKKIISPFFIVVVSRIVVLRRCGNDVFSFCCQDVFVKMFLSSFHSCGMRCFSRMVFDVDEMMQDGWDCMGCYVITFVNEELVESGVGGSKTQKVDDFF